MILPSKHISVAESLFGLGGYILHLLNQQSKDLDMLWLEFLKVNNKPKYPTYHSFDNFVLAMDYLYMIGAIDINQKGEFYNATT